MDKKRTIEEMSGCKTSGHCKEHTPCCYCEEARRILSESEGGK